MLEPFCHHLAYKMSLLFLLVFLVFLVFLIFLVFLFLLAFLVILFAFAAFAFALGFLTADHLELEDDLLYLSLGQIWVLFVLLFALFGLRLDQFLN